MPKPVEFHAAFARALAGISPHVVTLDVTDSTNDDARALAREDAPHLSVVVANGQRAGRGRLGRAWMSEPGLGLFASWIVRPALPVERWTIIPLLAGVAATDAVRSRTHVEVSLKWPNDLVVAGRKLGGILVEADPPRFCIVGLGANVSHLRFADEIGQIATSIALEGGLRLDRADLLAATLRAFEDALGDPDAAMVRYRERCTTIGQKVRVERSDGTTIEGVARSVAGDGALIVDGAAVQSGDVVHLRPA